MHTQNGSICIKLVNFCVRFYFSFSLMFHNWIWYFKSLLVLCFLFFVLFVFAQAAVRPWWVPSVGRNKKERSNFSVCTMKQSYMQVQTTLSVANTSCFVTTHLPTFLFAMCVMTSNCRLTLCYNCPPRMKVDLSIFLKLQHCLYLLVGKWYIILLWSACNLTGG